MLLHGTPFSSYIWRDIVPVLAANRRVYVWDMLGFGQSDKQDGQDVSLATQTRIFTELLDLWHLRKPQVIAHDVGGVVALRAALLEKVAFSTLTLINVASLKGWGDRRVFPDNPRTSGSFHQPAGLGFGCIDRRQDPYW